MGLDVTAYGGLSDAWPQTDPDEDGYPEWVSFYVNDAFPGMAGSVKENTFYRFSESFAFRAGSYSGYNAWRRELAYFIGTTPDRVWKGEQPRAFGELINFSDCEGTIGPEVSAKLAVDFSANLPAAEAWTDGEDSEWFIAKYKDWMKAFTIAANGGAVAFH